MNIAISLADLLLITIGGLWTIFLVFMEYRQSPTDLLSRISLIVVLITMPLIITFAWLSAYVL